MEMEYQDNNRRGKLIIALGVILALIAGATSFYLLNQATQSAGQGSLQKVAVVVAAKTCGPGADRRATSSSARSRSIRSPRWCRHQARGRRGQGARRAGVLGQPIYRTMIASSSISGFSILGPTETVGPDSEAWRAVSVTIPNERAVGGLLTVGQTIDIVMTATVKVPEPYASAGYYADTSTKVTYQDVVILARVESEYVIRVTLPVAEEILHMQATGVVSFSAALRPDQDVRYADVSQLGATTNRILQKYGLPWPVIYPQSSGRIPPQPPLQTRSSGCSDQSPPESTAPA
jgi:Flp pilus assembly protein CpaB